MLILGATSPAYGHHDTDYDRSCYDDAQQVLDNDTTGIRTLYDVRYEAVDDHKGYHTDYDGNKTSN